MAPTEEVGGSSSGNGGFQLGFEMRPLTSEGDLDTSLDSKGILHSLERDTLYKMACENREGGNKLVQESQYEQAIGRYSEAIMQLRSLESETDVKWDDLARLKGDKTVPDPADAVLAPDKRAKALFRRAQAHCEGFGNFDRARDDLRRAVEYAPGDKAVQQMLRKCEVAVRKTSRAADKKMAGFLKKEAEDGTGLFGDSLRPSGEVEKAPEPAEPVKVTEGLWLMPESGPQEKPVAEPGEEGGIDIEELGREITEMKSDNPELYAQLREKVRELAEQKAEELEKDREAPAGEGDASYAA